MLPHKRPRKTLSLPALGFILACLLLAVALTFVTWHNFNRESRLMEKFLLNEGQTLIRSFEAGARTTMMMMGSRQGNLPTLVEETAREKNIAYILIVDETGRRVAAAGNYQKTGTFPPIREVLSAKMALTRSTTDRSGQTVFEVAKPFSPLNAMPMPMMGMMKHMQRWGGQQDDTQRQIIYLGLYTAEFDTARSEDVKQSMPAGLISIDTERRVVSVNRNALEFFGRSEKEMQGKTLQQLLGDKECSIAPLLKAEQEFIDQPMECLLLDGEVIPLKVSASYLRDRDGNSRGMVLILRDQREIRAMEQALERSRRHAALGLMAAGIAHEIRNPLGTLRGFAQYFARSESSNDTTHEYANLMIGEVDRLNRTVSALLQFSRPHDAEIVPVDFGELLNRTIVFIQPDADHQQVSLQLSLATPEMTWPADADLLQQVLLNLLQNSLAATPEGGKIEVGAEQRENDLHVWVSDNGRGLSDEEQAKMFDPFFTTRKDGTGLGLAMVQQIVEQHNGQISVATKPGQGTRITLILPNQQG